MAVIENLDIVLGARTEKLDNGLDRSTGRVRKFEMDVGKIGKAAEATLAPLRDIGMSILAAVPGASAAATAFSAIAAAFAGSAASKVASETRETSRESAAAATAMTEFATAAVVAAAATRRIDVPDLPRLGSRGGGGGLALYNPATARAGARGGGMGDVIDAEFTQISTAAAGTSRSISMLGPVGIAAGAAVAAGFVAAAVGVKALQVTISGVREQMTAIDDLSDASKKLGMTFEDLAVSRLAIGESSGLDTGTIDNVLQRMQLGLAEARSGSGALHDQLSSLGLDAGKLLEAGPVEALKQISVATAGMKNPTDQLVFTYELLGKQGAAVVNTLREGPGAIEEASKFAKQFGLTLSQAQAEQVGAANDAWGRVELIATGAFRQIAAEVSPLLTVIAGEIIEIAKGFAGWGVALPNIVDHLAFMSGNLYDVVELILQGSVALAKLSELDFTGAFTAASAALDFGTGAEFMQKTAQARIDAENAAKNKTTGENDAELQRKQLQEIEDLQNGINQAAEDRVSSENRIKEAANSRLQALRDEVSVLGQGADALDRLNAARAFGANSPQLAEYDQLVATKKKHDEIASAMERGKEIAAQYRTPMQEFDAQLQDLNTLFNVGAIDFNTYAKATRDAARKAGDAQSQPERPKVAMLQRGSVEAFQQGNKNADAAKDATRSEKLLEMVNTNLEKIEQKLNLQTMGRV
jgi:hypothetical protein